MYPIPSTPAHVNTTPSPASDAKSPVLLPFYSKRQWAELAHLQLDAMRTIARQPCSYPPGSKEHRAIMVVRADLGIGLQQPGDGEQAPTVAFEAPKLPAAA